MRVRQLGVVSVAVSLSAALAGVLPSSAATAEPSPALGSIVHIEPGANTDTVVAALRADGIAAENIEVIASLDAVVVASGVPAGAVDDALASVADHVASVEDDPIAAAVAVVPTDPYFNPHQWGIGTAQVDDAWERTTGTSSTVVAVLDTGVSPVSDLAGALVSGYDFINDDADPVDDHGHGTQSASVIAARANNGIGMTGVCWSCTIVPVKVLASDGTGSHSAIAAGIVWAVDQGVDIVNLSLGSTSNSTLLTNAVNYALANDVLVLAAAGNNGLVQPFYPAALNGVVSVAGSDETDARYSWSNYGTTQVDIAAPGCNVSQKPDEAFYWFCGTSSATPFVAGVAALALAVHPELSSTDLAAALRAATVPNDFTRFGRIDASKLLYESPLVDVVNPVAWFTYPLPGRFLSGTFTATAGSSDSGVLARADLYVDSTYHGTVTSAPWAVDVDTAAYTSGVHTLRWRMFDAAGNVGVVQRSVVFDNAAPQVAFAAPYPSQPVQGTVTVSASASDDAAVAAAVLYAGSTVVGIDRSAPFDVQWDTSAFDEGPVTLRWRIFDKVGNVSIRSRTVIVDRAVPEASVAWPNPGRSVRGTIGVQTALSDNRGIAQTALLVNGAIVSTHAGAPSIITLDTSSFTGRTELSLRVTDKAGNVTYSPIRVVWVDTDPPSVSFVDPRPSATVSDIVDVTADITDAGPVARAALYANGQFVGATSSSPWTVAFDPSGFSGQVTLRWVVFDQARNRATVSRTVVVP